MISSPVRGTRVTCSPVSASARCAAAATSSGVGSNFISCLVIVVRISTRLLAWTLQKQLDCICKALSCATVGDSVFAITTYLRRGTNSRHAFTGSSSIPGITAFIMPNAISGIGLLCSSVIRKSPFSEDQAWAKFLPTRTISPLHDCSVAPDHAKIIAKTSH